VRRGGSAAAIDGAGSLQSPLAGGTIVTYAVKLRARDEPGAQKALRRSAGQQRGGFGATGRCVASTDNITTGRQSLNCLVRSSGVRAILGRAFVVLLLAVVADVADSIWIHAEL